MNNLAKKLAQYLKDRLNEGRLFIDAWVRPQQNMVELPVRERGLSRRGEVALNFAVSPPPLNAGEYARRRREG